MNDIVAQSKLAIAEGSQSFALASKLLPKHVRDDTVLLYAWCRYADDLIDGQILGHQGEIQLDQETRLENLRRDTLLAIQTDTPLAPPFEALRRVVRKHDIPEAWPMDLIRGFEMDVTDTHYETLADTLRYSYHVAGVVGLMMARVMGVRDPLVLDRACDLGLAFQLTNISRDVIDDARIHRTYLPHEWLVEAGAQISTDLPSPELYSVIIRLLDCAEPYYRSAQGGLPALPSKASWSIASAARIYHAIGDEIRRQGPQGYRSRIYTTKRQKLILVLQGSWDHIMRNQQKLVSREGLWNRPVDP